ncbi:MAG: hypothetical protein WD824_04740 [Cyclobacteriaceae bacterium]
MKQDILKTAILFLALLAAQKLSAQTEDALLQQLSRTENESSVNGVTIDQEGTNNEAFILQVTEASSSAVNALQTGAENRIQLLQTGNYIDIRISQEGAGNIYEADLEGQDSKIDISQSGFENIIFQSLMLNNTGISIYQQGDKNEVIHTGTSNNSGIQIQQQGSGMKLIIQSN